MAGALEAAEDEEAQACPVSGERIASSEKLRGCSCSRMAAFPLSNRTGERLDLAGFEAEREAARMSAIRSRYQAFTRGR
jgi:hypothetical protein